MTLTSQAKTRLMFARHPRLAKEFVDKTRIMAKLPEKVKKLPAKPKL